MSLKRYATALGYPDLVSCPQSAYNISAEERRQIIDENVRRIGKGGDMTGLSSRTLTNTRSDVTFVLREGATLGLIPGKGKSSGFKPNTGKPIYKYSSSHVEFRRGETIMLPNIAIPEKELPTLLREELDQYYVWSTSIFMDGRPRSRKRRPISAYYDREILRRIAGYHIRHCGISMNDLSLQGLTDADIATKYINWFIAHHGKATKTLKQVLIALLSLADYLQITAADKVLREAMAETSSQLREKISSLECGAVRDKELCWLSLERIELCAINRYPRNAARLAESSEAVRQKLITLNTKGQHSNLKDTAVHACASLFIRILVRIPLRLRNFCEMSWNPHDPENGKNLFRKNGSWYVRFSGDELKIGNRDGKIHSILHKIPKSLTWLVEEALTIWRPILTEVPYSLPDDGKLIGSDYREPPQTCAPRYKKAHHNVRLFLTRTCLPASRGVLRHWLKSATYTYAGVAVYPHLVRDIWATTYIKKKRDLKGAAKRLGITMQTVMKHYAHLLDDDAEADGDAFNREMFDEDKDDE